MSGDAKEIEAREFKVGDVLLFAEWECPVRKIDRTPQTVRLHLARRRIGFVQEGWTSMIFEASYKLWKAAR